MNFCRYLIRDINFEPDCIQPCCNIRSLSVPRFPFQGGKVHMLEYSKHINETIQLLQHGNICENCPEATRIDTDSSQVKILFHTVSFNMHRWLCNCKCIYCDFHKKKMPVYPILPAITSLYAQDVLHAACYFSWGGGESTILHEFEEAAAFIYDKGFKQYIHTNALHYSDTVAALLANASAGINISLDCGSPETYTIIKGLDKFDRVVENIGKYSARAQNTYDVTIKYIIFTANNSLDEIENFYSLCKDTGIHSVEFSFDFREVNTGAITRETLLAAMYFVKFAEELSMRCAPFFVDDALLGKMADLAGECL